MSKRFSLIYQGTVYPKDNAKIIPQEDYTLLVSAEEILEKAKEDATRYETEIKALCEQLKEAAKKDGFEEGLIQFNAHIIQFEKNLQALRLDLQKQILPLALKAAQKIVGEQLKLHPETIVDIVLQTLAPVTQNQRISIYVSKADKEILEAHRQDIKDLLAQVKSLTIQERADISPGGCIIETEKGIINATIENQWHALQAAFQRYTATRQSY